MVEFGESGDLGEEEDVDDIGDVGDWAVEFIVVVAVLEFPMIWYVIVPSRMPGRYYST